jgi:hypothetical protein
VVAGCPTVLMTCLTPWGGGTAGADVVRSKTARNRARSSSDQPEGGGGGEDEGGDGKAKEGEEDPSEGVEEPEGEEGCWLAGGGGGERSTSV